MGIFEDMLRGASKSFYLSIMSGLLKYLGAEVADYNTLL